MAMRFLKSIFSFFLFLLSTAAFAQLTSDSAMQLAEAVIDLPRLKDFTSGSKIVKIDSTVLQNYTNNNLGDLLAQQTGIFIKSSGPGNLSTISMRGTSANHTAVLWNGFNIQVPTLGQQDFSMLPVFLAEDIEIQYGGAGALYGSGAVGGAIHLNNPAQYGKGLKGSVTSTVGNFGNYFQALQLKASKTMVASSLKIFNSTAANNYSYINPNFSGDPTMHQTNAAVRQQGFVFENFLKISKRQQINMRAWVQDNYRQIPPPMPTPVSKAVLQDNFFRLSSEWKRNGSRTNWYVRSAWFSDRQIYNDPISREYSVTSFGTSISEAEGNVQVRSNHLLDIGLNNTFSTARSDGFSGRHVQNRTAIFASYKITNAKNTWRSIASLRQEMVSGKLVPLTPSLSFEGKLLSALSMKGHASRTYRIPTFDDLYWNPGGNPNIRPEAGWSEEIGWIAKPAWRFFEEKQLTFTVFNSNIHNWIIWLPQGSLWTPQNIQAVWARGLETDLKLSKKIGELKTGISLSYSYVVSTNQKVKSAGDQSYKKQLIYVPVYTAQGSVYVSWKNYYLNYIQTFTGNRFTTSDNTEYLKGYLLANIIFTKNIVLNKLRLNLNARVNNLWNVSYQVVQSQAMSGRYFQGGISIFFNKPNK